jgi:hypothetical protein
MGVYDRKGGVSSQFLSADCTYYSPILGPGDCYYSGTLPAEVGSLSYGV